MPRSRRPRALGGIDALVCTTGVRRLGRLVDIGVELAALDKLVEACRIERPTVGSSRVVGGSARGCFARCYLAGAILDADECVRVVGSVLGGKNRTTIPSVIVIPRPPV